MIAAITGANGFIGQHLARRFGEAGWQVRPVVRRDYESGAMGGLLSGADVVVHAAGATRAPSRDQLRASIVDLTARTLEASRAAGVGRFVYISSQAAAGPASSRDNPVTEASPPMPIGEYGRAKLDAEDLVRESENVSAVIVRPGAVYGPFDRDFLALHRLAARGVAVHPGNREQWISIVHVNDLADGILAASVSSNAAGQTFFMANETPVQWTELFRAAAACAGRELALDVQVPPALVDLGAALGDLASRLTGRAGLLTSDKAALSKPAFWICSSERARNLLGFLQRTNLQDGLCDTYHWYLTNGWL